MPTLAEIRGKLSTTKNQFDQLRHQHLAELTGYTKRPVVLYASSFSIKAVITRSCLYFDKRLAIFGLTFYSL